MPAISMQEANQFLSFNHNFFTLNRFTIFDDDKIVNVFGKVSDIDAH